MPILRSPADKAHKTVRAWDKFIDAGCVEIPVSVPDLAELGKLPRSAFQIVLQRGFCFSHMRYNHVPLVCSDGKSRDHLHRLKEITFKVWHFLEGHHDRCFCPQGKPEPRNETGSA